ncbi:type II secretion system F family protein [Nocardioides marmoribigeumensis]|uniref:Flp pilus assembly protein TadB n=1 Tax=Nocardioides marmoribigeumensis TaxID=433649 RepID=A0ABU2BW18_9ACTN|nr:type II secretion system F family protein [Nocardioides marmoribigeumensis]MDR7362830.1 Flp pilus assembly protein TadB [Nocardioides marmoribigeumensis]
MTTAWVAAVLAAAAAALCLPPAPRPVPGRDREARPARARAAPAPATWAALAAGAGVLLVAPGPLGLVAAAVVALGVRRKVASAETRTARRRRVAVEQELPHVVDLLASLMVAGAAPEEALERVRRVVHPAMAEELRPWSERLRLGADPSTVWTELADDRLLGRLGACLRRATASGAPVADALDRLGADLRAATRAGTLERVRQVEVRATAPLAACLLPAFVLLGVVPLVAGTVGRLGIG